MVAFFLTLTFAPTVMASTGDQLPSVARMSAGSALTLKPEKPIARPTLPGSTTTYAPEEERAARPALLGGGDRGPVAINDNGGYCIDSSHHKNGGSVVMVDCKEGNWNQMWTYTSSGQLNLYETGWCLDGAGDGNVHLWECGYDNWNQMWTYDSFSNAFSLKGTDNCLTINDGFSGTLRMDKCLYDGMQRFFLADAPTVSETLSTVDQMPSVMKSAGRVERTASSILAGEARDESTARPTLLATTYEDDGNWILSAPAKTEVSCDDVLKWCEDQQNFLTKNCDSTAKDFDPAACQNLYTVIGQSDCVVRAFRSPPSQQDPCSNAKLPDYDDQASDEMESMVSCENFSYAHVLCVDLFSKLNPSDTDIESAFSCIFGAAKQPEFAADKDAQNCLKFEDAVSSGKW